MSDKINKWAYLIAFMGSFLLLLMCVNDGDYGFLFYFSILLSSFCGWTVTYYDRLGRIKSSIEILNDYIIIEHIEVKVASTFHMTAQDQSKLVYKDALVKFTPKDSKVKPGDRIIYNKAMAYPYLLDGKQHFIITEEYIVAIK